MVPVARPLDDSSPEPVKFLSDVVGELLAFLGSAVAKQKDGARFGSHQDVWKCLQYEVALERFFSGRVNGDPRLNSRERTELFCKLGPGDGWPAGGEGWWKYDRCITYARGFLSLPSFNLRMAISESEDGLGVPPLGWLMSCDPVMVRCLYFCLRL